MLSKNQFCSRFVVGWLVGMHDHDWIKKLSANFVKFSKVQETITQNYTVGEKLNFICVTD